MLNSNKEYKKCLICGKLHTNKKYCSMECSAEAQRNKNTIKIIDNTSAKLIIDNRRGTYEFLIDKEDIRKIEIYHWVTTNCSVAPNSIRVWAKDKHGKELFTLGMLLLNIDNKKLGILKNLIYFRNGNKKDYRKNNLFVDNGAFIENNTNKARSNNKSTGIRNVYYEPDRNKYKVIVQLGNKYHTERFNTIGQAIKRAKELRKELHYHSIEALTINNSHKE